MPSKPREVNQKPVVTPIFQSTTFEFPDTKSLIGFQKGKRKGYIYTRYGNPTIEAVEKRMAALDGAESSLAFSSGMGAISSLCFAFLKTGDEIVSSSPVYGGTASFFDRILSRLKIKTRYFPAEKIDRLERLITKKTKLVYLESPTNPNLRLVDLEEAARIAKKYRVLSVIDSTFATPVNQKPLDFGLDAVVHSATKYLGGHSDIMGGVVSGPRALIDRVAETRKYLGCVMDPGQAFLLERGLKTLEVRVERHNHNAMEIATFLENHRGVKRVVYPGLKSHPQHDIASGQMTGFGGMISFDLGSGSRAIRFADSLKVVKNAVSLGGIESLVSIPVWTSHHGFSRKQLKRFGVSPGMVRLSVGLENCAVLIRDISRALRRATGF